MKNLKKNGGITLVALVITIIVLLILAGISIQAITNQGLFARANEAKRESKIANIKEKIALDIYEKQLEPPLGSITEEQLEIILGKYGTVNKEDGTIVGITTEKGYEILLKDIYGGETVAESVPDGAIVTPVNDITTWLKTGEISKQYSYTTIEQVIADSACTESLMKNENAMKYLARSTEFADAICSSETTMTSLGKSAYVDDTVLNNDLWLSAIALSQYYDKVLKPVELTVGSTYSFCGYGWIAAEQPNSNYVVLQSTGVTSGAWPGYSMSGTLTNAAGTTITLTGANSHYQGNIDGYDISGVNSTMTTLYNSIKSAEYSSASYGKGLYLVSNEKCGQTVSYSAGVGNYWEAQKIAASSRELFSATYNNSWLGTYSSSVYAWSASPGVVYDGSYQNYSFVIAPAFNLDTRLIKLNANTIELIV